MAFISQVSFCPASASRKIMRLLCCLWLALAALPAWSAATAMTQLSASLSVVPQGAALPGSLLTISDDGSDAATTGGIVSPDGGFGSLALASGSMGPEFDPATLTGRVAAQALAIGLDGLPLVLAVSQAQVEGGFVLVNDTADEMMVDLLIDWAWMAEVAAGSGALDVAIGALSLDLLLDDRPLQRLVDLFSSTSPNESLSDQSSAVVRATLAPFSEASYALRLQVLGIAQEGAPQQLGEPSTSALVALLVTLCLLRVKRRSTSPWAVHASCPAPSPGLSGQVLG